MPSVPERLTSLEAAAADLKARLTALHADIHGDQNVGWDQSIRGRLHKLSSDLAAVDKLADAVRQDTRQRAVHDQSRIRRWQWAYLAICATAAALAPYVVLIFHG